MRFTPEHTNTGLVYPASSGVFRGCNSPIRYDGTLSRTLFSFVSTDGPIEVPRLTFHGGRVQRVYPSEHRKPWGVRYNRLLRLTRRLHG